nr:unnamed protein product [Digitaria exilis]
MAPHGAASPEPDDAGVVQLLLRNIDSRTAVVRARREDTVGEVLDRLGAGAAELRAVHGGRELPLGATVGELGLPRDATLHLSYRLSSSAPRAGAAWGLASEIAAAAAGAHPYAPPDASSFHNLVVRFLASASSAAAAHPRAIADHMDAFRRSGVIDVLAQLYHNSYADEERRSAAERAIRCFLYPDADDATTTPVKPWTAPVLVELCRCIGIYSPAGDDELYIALRATLATVLSDPKWTPEHWHVVPRRWLAEQLTWLAGDAANAIVQEIAGVYGSWSVPAAAIRGNLAEFKTFSSVLRQQVLELDVDTRLHPWRVGLSQMLVSLLMAINDSMARFEMTLTSPESTLPKWTATSLETVWIVLAELDEWPDLHGEMRAMLAAHRSAVSALVLSAGRDEFSESIRWITRHRDVLEFEARRHLAMAMLPELVSGSYALLPFEMLIDRARLLPDTFGYIAHATVQELRADLSVAFRHEQATGPGMLREWMCLVFQALFNPRLVLFSACPHDRRRFFINPGEFAF